VGGTVDDGAKPGLTNQRQGIVIVSGDHHVAAIEQATGARSFDRCERMCQQGPAAVKDMELPAAEP
jgi:hypothetical protein